MTRPQACPGITWRVYLGTVALSVALTALALAIAAAAFRAINL